MLSYLSASRATRVQFASESSIRKSDSKTWTSKGHTWSSQAMCRATASRIASLENSVGIFIDGNFSNDCLDFAASLLAFFTASGMHRKFSAIGGAAALQHFSYSSKWWPAMWPRHVLFDPSRKHALNFLFGRIPFLIVFSVSSLHCQVSFFFEQCVMRTHLQILHHRPSSAFVTTSPAFPTF
jgi:hypothetical protein